jgi:hypothetical protein
MMPDQTPLPSFMVEGVARALYADDNRYDEIGDGWDRLTDGYQEQYRKTAIRALAAALEDCEVREEWGVEIDKGDGFRLSPHPSVPYWALSRAEIRQYYDGIVKPKRLVTRLVITTRPEPVPTTPEEQS